MNGAGANPNPNIDLVDVTFYTASSSLNVTDIAGNELSFGLTGWDPFVNDRDIDEQVDAAVTARVTEVRYDLQNFLKVTRSDGSFQVERNGQTTAAIRDDVGTDRPVRYSLPEGQYRCSVESSIIVHLCFDGAGTIRYRPESGLTISFPHPTTVTFGFKTYVDYPRHELTVEPTTAGFATAVSHLGAAITTTTVDRVHRNHRGYPPTIRLGSETTVPAAVEASTPDTGIELLIPDSLSALLPVAPLAYYLGARVSVQDDSAPILRAPAVDVHHEFDPLPAFEGQAATLLKRVFFLDMLATWYDDSEWTVRAHSILESAGIDLEPCVEAPLAERLEAYLSFPGPPLEDALPSWPYRMTVEPSPESVAQLPHLLYDMAAIELPKVAEATEGTKVAEVTETTEAMETTEATKEVAEPTDATDVIDGTEAMKATKTTEKNRSAVDFPSNNEQRFEAISRLRGRLQPGGVTSDPTDAAFTSMPAAYRNRLEYLGADRRQRAVVVAFTDEIADAERASVVDRYRRRDDVLSPTVTALEDPSREELADVFETGVDFLHVIGDCSEAGIRCRDGVLEPASLEENNVQLFQIDGPRSLAVDLVEHGSVAGAVGVPGVAGTAGVGGDHDDDVGRSGNTTVGELLLYGHSLATATQCAASTDNTQPRAVVGDGSYRFVASWWPTLIYVLSAGGRRASKEGDDECTANDGDARGDSDGLRVTAVPFPIDPVGGYAVPNWGDGKRLQPNPLSFEVDPGSVTDFLAESEAPIYYDGRFYWPEEQLLLAYPIA
ncbi:hypothetical protein [Natronosalvus halobius]|uniref:hypothetical protein n=1 Tax=Natronosalvus halobius TaxID=2953746 RepID=UPI00209F83D6|nr:hypothetical protein [Natronosalvus halobius]USZ72839.1 hypothetical protein NGM15_05915 [Natronosalvus halobius]